MKAFAKKGAVALSILALTGSVLAGCGKDAKPEGTGNGSENVVKQELNVAVFEGGYGKAYWEQVAKKFESDHPGVTVKLTANPKIMDVIKPQIIAGNPPDFIYSPISEPTGTIQAMIKEKAFLDITDVFESNALDQEVPLKDKMLDGILEYAKPYSDDKIYYGPSYVSTNGLWYNKTLFEQKGWKVPVTWDDFFALGEVAKADGRSLFTYQGIYPGYNETILWPSIASVGGLDLIKKLENYEDGAYTSAEVKQALSVFSTIADKGYLMPGTVALNHTQSQTEFLKGKALFVPNGNWFENEMSDAPREEGFEFGFMVPPVFKEGDTAYAITAFEALFIPAKAKNVELAKEFMKYQYNDDNLKLNAELSKGVMATKNGIELAKEYVPASVYDSLKIFETGVQPLNFQLKVTPKTEVDMKNETFQPISSLMNKELTVDKWAERMETASDKLRNLIEKAK